MNMISLNPFCLLTSDVVFFPSCRVILIVTWTRKCKLCIPYVHIHLATLHRKWWLYPGSCVHVVECYRWLLLGYSHIFSFFLYDFGHTSISCVFRVTSQRLFIARMGVFNCDNEYNGPGHSCMGPYSKKLAIGQDWLIFCLNSLARVYLVHTILRPPY